MFGGVGGLFQALTRIVVKMLFEVVFAERADSSGVHVWWGGEDYSRFTLKLL